MSVRSWAAVAVVAALAIPVLMWAPAGAQEPKKPEKAPAGTDVFGHDKLWQFHLTLAAKDYDAMQPPGGGFGFGPGFGKGPNPPKAEPKPGEPKRDSDTSAFGTEFPWVRAALAADGKTTDNVGLRYKGNSTYMATARGLKRSMKVELDHYDPETRFRGLRTLNLHCGVMDATKAREALTYWVYRAAGVPAPRTAFAEVTLSVPGKYDKEYLGLYILVEQVNKAFLKDRYKTDAGLLMKPERVGSLAYLGEDWERYKPTYQPKRDATKEESKRVIDFTRLVNQGTDEQFNREIASYLDVDAFLRFMAATALVSNLDSFFTLGHNYYLYLHPETKKFHFIPWDVDLAMGNFALFGSAEQQMDLSLTRPYAQNRLADRLMANKEFAERYQTILKELVPVCFTKEKLLGEIEAIEKTTKELIEKDKKAAAGRKEGGGFGFGPGGGFGQPVPDLRRFVEKRTESVAAQLSGKSKGFVPAGFGFGPPGGFARPVPGEVLSQAVQGQLQLTEAQKKQIAELQKEVDAKLEKILTEQQRSQFKRMREGGGGFGPPPGGFGPKGGGPGVAPPPKPKGPPQP